MLESTVVLPLISEHAEEASFLWLQRSLAVDAPQYGPTQFADLDERLTAQIDGLRVAEQEGWQLANEQVATGEPEDLFPAAVLAIEAGGESLDGVFELVANSREALPGMLSAFGWVSAQFLGGTVSTLLASDLPLRRLVGIAACAMHRKDPGERLPEFFVDPSRTVRARALRTAGELGRQDLLPDCRDACADANPRVGFWAAWSAVLLGDCEMALKMLTRYAVSPQPKAERALRLALCAMDLKASAAFLKQLAEDPLARRSLITGCGLSGDPQYCPWLLKQMQAPETAKLAGEAFTLITGLNIYMGDFESPGPDDFEAGPTEDPEDEDVSVDADASLPWPNLEKVSAWWDANQARFTTGRRYFLGEPPSIAHCQDVLRKGYQRQRVLAALHLALLQPGSVLFPTSAPAWRQKRLLAQEYAEAAG